jgi:hypothetical protein
VVRRSPSCRRRVRAARTPAQRGLFLAHRGRLPGPDASFRCRVTRAALVPSSLPGSGTRAAHDQPRPRRRGGSAARVLRSTLEGGPCMAYRPRADHLADCVERSCRSTQQLGLREGEAQFLLRGAQRAPATEDAGTSPKAYHPSEPTPPHVPRPPRGAGCPLHPTLHTKDPSSLAVPDARVGTREREVDPAPIPRLPQAR